ncbi:MAG: HPr family phosphocarrier protein [Eubacteriales bacterium]|nr:HPr family phosphocarrier protein [Eubacteriales bacterium]
MLSKSVTVKLPSNADARPVAVLVQIASKFDSRIFLIEKNKKINAKSIMGMMSLGFSNGDILEVEADGADETEAVAELAAYIESGK